MSERENHITRKSSQREGSLTSETQHQYCTYEQLAEEIKRELGVTVSTDYLVHLRRTHHLIRTQIAIILGREVERIPLSEVPTVMEIVRWHKLDKFSWKEIKQLILNPEQRAGNEVCESLITWYTHRTAHAWDLAMEMVAQHAQMTFEERTLVFARQDGLDVNECADTFSLDSNYVTATLQSADLKISRMLLASLGTKPEK